MSHIGAWPILYQASRQPLLDVQVRRRGPRPARRRRWGGGHSRGGGQQNSRPGSRSSRGRSGRHRGQRDQAMSFGFLARAMRAHVHVTHELLAAVAVGTLMRRRVRRRIVATRLTNFPGHGGRC